MVDFVKTVFLKKEAIYGTDAVPTGAANAVLTRNFQATPLQVDQIERNLDGPSRGATPSAPSNRRRAYSFEVELAGSGTAGQAPAWMELLEACGMAPPTLTAGSKAEQRFAAPGAAISSLTSYDWIGDQKRVGLGARGDITSIDFTAGAYPFLGLDFQALVPAVPVSTAATLVPDFTRWKKPVEVNTTNSLFTLDGYAAKLRYLRLQANANVSVRNLVGANYVQRGNHALRGKAMIEAPQSTAKNFHALVDSGATVPLNIVHGLLAGNIVQLDAGFVQVLFVAESNEDDVLMYELDLQLNISAGQDDLLLTAK